MQLILAWNIAVLISLSGVYAWHGETIKLVSARSVVPSLWQHWLCHLYYSEQLMWKKGVIKASIFSLICSQGALQEPEEESSGQHCTGSRTWFVTRHSCEAEGHFLVKGLWDFPAWDNLQMHIPKKTKTLKILSGSIGWVDFHDRSKSCIFSESHIKVLNTSEGMLTVSTRWWCC